MKSVACLISICEDEHASVLVDIGNRIEYFNEYVWQEDRVGR
jgi:hypothetical protein